MADILSWEQYDVDVFLLCRKIVEDATMCDVFDNQTWHVPHKVRFAMKITQFFQNFSARLILVLS